MNGRDVLITGMGIASPIGNTVPTFFGNLMEGRSGITPASDEIRDKFPKAVWAPVKEELWLDEAAARKYKSLERATQFALFAAHQATTDCGFDKKAFRPEMGGVYWGVGMSGMHTLEGVYERILLRDSTKLRPTTVTHSMSNAAAAWISLEFQCLGPSITYSNACASAAIAVAEASKAIRDGSIDWAIVGGAEAVLVKASYYAWEAIGAISHEDERGPMFACRPFSGDRTGIVLGEGAGALILESREHAASRRAKIYGRIAGSGITSDGANMVSPSVAGQVRAIEQALRRSSLSVDEIDYINAHGTGTDVGDLSETNSLKEVFGPHAVNIPISSTKSMHGHLLGASAAIELIATVMAISEQAIPPTIGCIVKDPACDLDYVTSGGRVGVKLRNAMSNSFAFGGSNACLIVSQDVG